MILDAPGQVDAKLLEVLKGTPTAEVSLPR
jgi:hypothetical protein